jgi:hypothetical protein
MALWAIRHKGNRNLYWSSTRGWAIFEQASVYTDAVKDYRGNTLPTNGEWFHVEHPLVYDTWSEGKPASKCDVYECVEQALRAHFNDPAVEIQSSLKRNTLVIRVGQGTGRPKYYRIQFVEQR